MDLFINKSYGFTIRAIIGTTPTGFNYVLPFFPPDKSGGYAQVALRAWLYMDSMQKINNIVLGKVLDYLLHNPHSLG
ncbi:MAG: hypothetical protein Q8907_08740 [Bacteroidota bacterium]|nr:hypothetical protein [Bacteroidota bacterium]MDP4274350.1 hypothetical protein [Bacteroidota bacterium]